MKKRIMSRIILLAIIVLGLNFGLGIIQANESLNAFGVLIDNQTGESVTSISLTVKAFDKGNGNEIEKQIKKSFNEMKTGDYEEFIFNIRNGEQVSEQADFIMSITIDGESHSVEATKGVLIKAGKRTLIKLVGNRSAGFKAEFVELL